MRDTLIGLTMFLGMIGGYFYFNQSTEQSLPVSVADSNPNPNPNPNPQTSGVKKHESSFNRPSKNQGARSRKRNSARASKPVDEDVELPSLYSSQETERSESAPVDFENPEDLNAPGPTKDVVHGVPVLLWAKQKLNSFYGEVPDPNVGTGTRFFVQCMEWKKKGLEYQEKDCAALLAQAKERSKVNFR